MKKYLRIVAAFAVVLFFASCASTNRTSSAVSENSTATVASSTVTTAPVVTAPVATTSVASIDKYGNATLSISYDEFSALGFAPGDIASVSVSGFAFDAPVCTSYSDVDNGRHLIRMNEGSGAVALAINMGNFAKTSGAVEGSDVTIALAQKAGYLAEWQLRQLEKSENRGDYASDEIFANFRAVRTTGIAAGKLYRSCNPVYGDARAPYAERLVASAGIQTVVNLADSRESAAEHFDEAPYYKSLAESGNVVFLNMGVAFTDDDFIKKLHDGLVFIGSGNAPFLVHCNEGKDRAGYVCALLEALCGATLDEIKSDYMTSFENYYGVQKGTAQYDAIGNVILDSLKTLNGGAAVNDKNVARVVENYLRSRVGLTRGEIDAVKAALM